MDTIDSTVHRLVRAAGFNHKRKRRKSNYISGFPVTESQLHLQIIFPQIFLSHRTRSLGDIKSGNILANLNLITGGALRGTVVRAFGGQTHVGHC